jgi:hypothetical protein
MKQQQKKNFFPPLEEREQLFLTGVIRSFVTGQDRPVPPPDLNWINLNAFILSYHLGPLFSWALDDVSVPKPLALEGQQQYRKTWISNLLINKVAVKLFNLLETGGIDAVGLRGLHLANFIYPDPALRPMADLDILIRPKDRDRLIEVLAGNNHHPTKMLRSQLVYLIEGITIEVHWSFLTTKRYRMEFEAEELLAAAETRMLPQGPVKVLAREQQLIDLVAHGFIHHEFSSFMQLIDLAFFLVSPEIKWDFILTWCRKHHLIRMFVFSLSLVNRWLSLDRGSFWEEYSRKWAGLDSATDSYLRRLFGTTTFSDQWRRALVLLYVAEKPGVKFRQILRFFSTGNLWIPGRQQTS